jgi:hypothetical protein
MEVKPNFTVADEATVSKPPSVEFNTTTGNPPPAPAAAPK